MKPALQATVLAIAILGAGAGSVTLLKADVRDLSVPSVSWQPGNELDGRVFRMSGVITETGAEMPETIFSFVKGRFQSSRCQIYCDFGWNEYQTWKKDDVTHFTVTTRCPDAPHTVVWYGTVTGDRMNFAGTWTTRRWYWNRQMTIDGEGTPITGTAQADRG